MSVNKSNKSACLPANIYCEHTYDRYKEDGLRLLEKYMPYLNPETGLRNRMITRDPVTGLGDLEAEWNPLNGCHINRKTFPHRDPITMQGDMGTEYNCLYTTKELSCKSRVNRDPVTLQGDLGEEVDFFRPHGGKPRNRIENNINTIRRDPITGTGENGRETESVRQYNGRLCNGENSKRYSYLATDPITHSLPETKLVRSQSVRHYKETWATRDPIGYMHRASISYKTDRARGMRHFQNNNYNNSTANNNKNSDPITHRYSIHRPSFNNNTPSKYNSNASRVNIDPITHQTKVKQSNNQLASSSSAEPNDETTSTITIDDCSEMSVDGNLNSNNSTTSTIREDRRLRRAIRNPITGEGMYDSDYIDLLKLPSEYYFRRNRDTSSSILAAAVTPATTKKAAVPSQKETPAPIKPIAHKPAPQTPSQQQAPATPSQNKPSESKLPASSTTTQAPEKKVVRPKKVEPPPPSVEKKSTTPPEKQPVAEKKLSDSKPTSSPSKTTTDVTEQPSKNDVSPKEPEETSGSILPQPKTERRQLAEDQTAKSLSEELELAMAGQVSPQSTPTTLDDNKTPTEVVKEATPPPTSNTPSPPATSKTPSTPPTSEVPSPPPASRTPSISSTSDTPLQPAASKTSLTTPTSDMPSPPPASDTPLPVSASETPSPPPSEVKPTVEAKTPQPAEVDAPKTDTSPPPPESPKEAPKTE